MNYGKIACIVLLAITVLATAARAEDAKDPTGLHSRHGLDSRHTLDDVGDFYRVHDEWYEAPREIQVLDERPVVRYFREAPAQKPIALPPGLGAMPDKKPAATSELPTASEFQHRQELVRQSILRQRVLGQRAVGQRAPGQTTDGELLQRTIAPVSGDTFTQRELQLIQKRGVVDPSGNGSYLWRKDAPVTMPDFRSTGQ